MSRPELSVEYIMTQQKYLNILQLIQEYSMPKSKERITIDHLRYKFLPNWKRFNINEEEMMSFFKDTPFTKMRKEEYKNDFEQGKITGGEYKKNIKAVELYNKNKTDFSTEDKITGDANLKKYLRNLKKFELIKIIWRKKGKPYYKTKELGMKKILRYLVEQSLKLIPDEIQYLSILFSDITLLKIHIEKEKLKK